MDLSFLFFFLSYLSKPLSLYIYVYLSVSSLSAHLFVKLETSEQETWFVEEIERFCSIIKRLNFSHVGLFQPSNCYIFICFRENVVFIFFWLGLATRKKERKIVTSEYMYDLVHVWLILKKFTKHLNLEIKVKF